MRVVVAGASGFLGQPLISWLRDSGHEVVQLVRRPPSTPLERRWDPASSVELPAGTDAVINLSGARLADRRWTAQYRRVLRDSRLITTRTLADAVSKQGVPLLISASGVGFYGDTGDRTVDELAPPGDTFLARLCADWEAVAASATTARVVMLRIGAPLDRRGGYLQPQLRQFRSGFGGTLGSGAHWIPWISMVDCLRAVEFIATHEGISGPVNVVSPNPVRQTDFAKALAAALGRPARLRIPKAAVKLRYGELGEDTFRSFRATPTVLLDNGFTYQHPTLAGALEAALR